MKKTLKILGIIFICFILIGIVGFSILNYFGSKYDKESRAYANKTIPLIITTWNPEELISRSNTELLNIIPPEKLQSLFRLFSDKLGSLEEYKGLNGGAGIHIDQIGIAVTAEYIADADFEKAPAKIKIQLVKQNSGWYISGFSVISNTLPW